VRGGLFTTSASVLIRSARVPVIRVTSSRIPGSDREVKVDISMGVSNGARAVAFVQRQVQAMPPLRPLVLVLKALLKQHNLNEARLGGLSSYCLLNMVCTTFAFSEVFF
jgi:non-canonical poly(A) RNA polymerase PAPD5/7